MTVTQFGDQTEAAFFDFMRACRANYRKLADAIHATVGPHAAADIGCGVGDVPERLNELGWSVVGYEFSPVARSMAMCPIYPFDWTDLRTPELPKRQCTICTETAEHIDDKYAPRIASYISAITTDVIVFSAAQPGQEWPGHVNLQPIHYWLGMFHVYGWRLDKTRTEELRIRMWDTQAQHCYAKENFCVLVPK